ncbi:hypothetical protein F5880DRAFT_1618227 [Lentinula raphanica]|nr:hypothetical protein F5880DRAFT_1618227 [Lentinula raphanica]
MVPLPPAGNLTNCLNTLSVSVRRWFLDADLPLPSRRNEAEPEQLQIDNWLVQLNESIMAKSKSHWQNLMSGQLESYQSVLDQRAKFRDIAMNRRLLLDAFRGATELCKAEGQSSLTDLVFHEEVLFRRASLVVLAISQNLERTINSWKDTHPLVADVLLNKRISALQEASEEYTIPKTAWNDEYTINHEDLARMSSLQWLNSKLIDVFISKLNAKFSYPLDSQQCVAYLDTNFAYHYILPASKPHDTLKNSQGRIRYKPLKALQSRFENEKISLIVPLNMNNSHWFIGVICRASSTIQIYDSLGRGKLDTQTYHTAYKNMQEVWQVLVDAWPETLGIQAQLRWKLEIISKINNSDCGIFAIMFMMHLGYGPLINHEQVPVLYRLPAQSRNLAGLRLLLLEELDLSTSNSVA